MKVRIESISEENKYGEVREYTKVYVDGDRIADGGYGGEPEDNRRSRDYSWVEDSLEELARRLGAEVEVVRIERPRR